ncbi:MAG TPA: DUF4352 domain-containing protein [Clostridium sp.]
MSKLTNCKACKEEIAKGVKKCVNCGADQRSFAGRHKIITGILAIAILGGIGSAMGDGNKTDSAKADSSTSTAVSATTPAPVAKPAETVISTEGISSDVKIKVLEVTTPAYTGKDSFKHNPQGAFVVVKLSIQNNQKDAISVTDSSFKLLDKDKREFDASTDASIGMMMVEKKTFMFENVNPGNTIEGYIVYDVPKGLTGFTMQATGGMTGKPIILKIN